MELNDDNVEDLIITIMHLIEDYMNQDPQAISEPEFHEELLMYLIEIIFSQFEDVEKQQNIDDLEDFFYELEEIIEISNDLYFDTIVPKRSLSDTKIICSSKKNKDITNKIQYLLQQPQFKQRTLEWYEHRNNLITASNAYKTFGSIAVKNSLIYEKCNAYHSMKLQESQQQQETSQQEDLDPNVRSCELITPLKESQVNVNTTLHWGQKYEPLSVMLYEERYKTKIGEFGCISHPKYSFIGASPDGINIDPNSDRYGRMLEIKNIVNRVIDGQPKKEYWIQMQLQMEVCDLDECDFLETRFIEYENTEEFLNDGEFTTSSNNELKGIIMYFAKDNGNPHYEYMPLSIMDEEEFEEWRENKMEEFKDYTWIKNIYWRLNEYSCVLVQRNRNWFQQSIDELKSIWNIIEIERKSDFEHRAPKRKKITVLSENVQNSGSGGCLLNVNKLFNSSNIE